MGPDRRSVLKLIPVAAGRALAGSVPLLDSTPKLQIELPRVLCRPLDEMKVGSANSGTNSSKTGPEMFMFGAQCAIGSFARSEAGSVCTMPAYRTRIAGFSGLVPLRSTVEADCKTEIHDE